MAGMRDFKIGGAFRNRSNRRPDGKMAERMPQIRFALSRGFAVSGLFCGRFTQGGARRLACPGLLSAALIRLSVCGFADRQDFGRDGGAVN
jgi:hypothetical protein